MRAVLVGCGLITARWVRTVLTDGRVQLAALVDPDHAAARRLAERHQLDVPHYPRLAPALAQHPGLQIVINVTPPWEHAEVTLAAVRAGLHVLSEKPLTPTYQQARQILAAQHGGRAQVQVMHNRGRDRQWLALAQVVRRHDPGPLHLHCDVSVALPRPGFRSTTPHVATIDLAVHAFDQARQVITAPPRDVLADEAALTFLDGHCTTATVLVRFTDGSILSYRGGYVTGPLTSSANGRWQIRGRHVAAYWDGETGPTVCAADGTSLPLSTPESSMPPYAACITEMIDRLGGAGTDYPDVEWSTGSVAMLDAALRSLRSGHRTPVEVAT